MVMRYHWSLGIGHTYSHGTNVKQSHHPSLESVEPHHEGAGLNDTDEHSGPAVLGGEEEDPDPDDPELAMDERENEDLGPEQEEWMDDNFEESDDELFEMYFL